MWVCLAELRLNQHLLILHIPNSEVFAFLEIASKMLLLSKEEQPAGPTAGRPALPPHGQESHW